MLWETFSGRLRNFIRGRIGNREDAEDLLQEVFLKIHLHIDALKDALRPEAWIYRVARNAIIDFYRRQRPEESADEQWLQQLPDPEDADMMREMIGCLSPYIAQLPEKYRVVIEMSELKGMPHKRIAAKLGLSVSAIKSRVQRAREMIRNDFEHHCKIKLGPHGMLVRIEAEECGCTATACCAVT